MRPASNAPLVIACVRRSGAASGSRVVATAEAAAAAGEGPGTGVVVAFSGACTGACTGACIGACTGAEAAGAPAGERTGGFIARPVGRRVPSLTPRSDGGRAVARMT